MYVKDTCLQIAMRVSCKDITNREMSDKDIKDGVIKYNRLLTANIKNLKNEIVFLSKLKDKNEDVVNRLNIKRHQLVMCKLLSDWKYNCLLREAGITKTIEHTKKRVNFALFGGDGIPYDILLIVKINDLRKRKDGVLDYLVLKEKAKQIIFKNKVKKCVTPDSKTVHNLLEIKSYFDTYEEHPSTADDYFKKIYKDN